VKKVRHLLSLFALGLLCTGCWPLRLTSSPGASGVLVDAQTHWPISGATAVVCNPLPSPFEADWPTFAAALTNARPPQVISDKGGTFFIPPKHQWAIYHPMPTLAPARGYLIVRQDGYEPKMIGICTNGTENVGTVFLNPTNPALAPRPK
jgi:hypothetical protein